MAPGGVADVLVLMQRCCAGLEVWLRYFAVGGSSTAAEVGAYIIGVLQPGWYEYDMIAVAINEALIDKGLRSAVAYSDEKPGGFSSRAAADAG
jgi:hypothetical protein